MPGEAAAAANFIYSEVCEVLQAGLTQNNEHHEMVFKGLKAHFERYKTLTAEQIQLAQRILGDYEGRKQQQRLF